MADSPCYDTERTVYIKCLIDAIAGGSTII